MNLQGHPNITRAALNLVARECPEIQQFCRVLRNDENHSHWIDPALSSSAGAGLEYAGYVLRKHLGGDINSIALQVMAVDVGEYEWTQEDPLGQPYHFMKAPGETDLAAYQRGCDHIESHLRKWIAGAQWVHRDIEEDVQRYRAVKATRKAPLSWPGYQNYGMTLPTGVVGAFYADSQMLNRAIVAGAHFFEMREHRARLARAQKFLAVALHALQDSFAYGHTLRAVGKLHYDFANGNEPILGHFHNGDPAQPAPIRKIYDYSKQNHHLTESAHAKSDCHSGSLNQTLAKSAVLASADLMRLGIQTIIAKKPLTGWNRFRDKWLAKDFSPEKIYK